MPAVVIGDHRHRGVAQLGLAGELGFRHVGHADHVAAPLAVQLGFGQAAELRAFHHQVGAAAHGRDASLLRCCLDVVAQTLAHRMRHGDMGHEARAEEGFFAGESAVDELIDDDEGAGRQVLAQRAHRADRDDIADADALEHIDVGAEVDRGRRDLVAAAVARQEGQLHAVQFAEQQLVGRCAEWRFDLLPAFVGQPLDVVYAAAADDADACLPHDAPCPIGIGRD